MDPWPEALVKSSQQMDGNQVYLTMNGPTEFDVIGLLRDWDSTYERSAHVAHLEEGERFAEVVEQFLREVETRP